MSVPAAEVDELAGRPGPQSQAKPGRRSRGWTGYVLAAPYVAMLAVFGVGPTLYAVYLSLVDESSGQFVGLWNFAQIIQDYRFNQALVNVLIYIAFWVPFQMVTVIVVSLVLQARTGRFTGAMKMLYYLPGAFTGSAAVLLWIFILDPNIGPFRWLLRLSGAQFSSDIVSTGRLPLIFAFMAFTSGAGGWIIIMYGALNGVSTDVLESARLDGASRWQLATRIQLPLLKKYVVYMFVLTFCAGFQIYAEPQMINPFFGVGDTSTTSGDTWSINQLALVVGIQEGKIGQASALALLVLLLGIAVALYLIFRTDFFDTKENAK